MEEENVATRLKSFMDYLGLTNSQFADTCGIPRPSLSQFLSGRNKKLSYSFVKQIHEHFPQLNVVWLMFGEGEMIMPEPINPGLASEAAKFMDNPTEIDLNDNLRQLNTPGIGFNSTERQENNANLHTHEKTPQIEKIEVVERKIKSITIFFDDNSYEIFKPEHEQDKK